MTKCFFIEPIDKTRRYLRRYTYGDVKPCSLNPFNHHQMNLLDETQGEQTNGDLWPHDDIRWPKQCKCGYEFVKEDMWQLFCVSLYKRTDTNEEVTLQDVPGGAMWYADWMGEDYKGPDGHCLTVKLPNGRQWIIDSRASNCTKPEDKEHKCWVRHGTIPNITVDKNGLTCEAGGGSIIAGDWHGFLRNGELVL